MKLGFKQKLALGALDKAVDFVRRDPERYLPAVLRIVERLDGDHMYQDVYDYLRRMLDDKDNNARAFAMRMLREADPLFLRRFVSNFLVRSGIIGYARQKALSAELDCNIPWAILMDPTSACNLHCTGCWAADYDHGSHLPYEVLDRIVREGTELGTHFYLFSGGEPLVRKNVALRLCREHPDCFFLAFTNGTLVDEEFADALREVGNFTLAFSIEGFEEETDMRRGKGTYRKVIRAMNLLRKARVPFGFSTCYHAKNTHVVGSDAYMDFLIDKGAIFAWYFTYMPVGNDAVPELLASAEQRAFMYRQVRRFRSTKPIFALDFWNDGEYVGGCIAGGRRDLHINATGAAAPRALFPPCFPRRPRNPGAPPPRRPAAIGPPTPTATPSPAPLSTTPTPTSKTARCSTCCNRLCSGNIVAINPSTAITCAPVPCSTIRALWLTWCAPPGPGPRIWPAPNR